MYALAIYTPILTTSEASIFEYVGYFSYWSAKKEDHVEHHYQVSTRARGFSAVENDTIFDTKKRPRNSPGVAQLSKIGTH